MLRLVALGGLTLLDDGRPVVGSAARGRNIALLALLARAGEAGLTREKLATYLWPESDASRSRHSLDQAFYTLRRSLGAEAFLAGGNTVALDRSIISSDVVDFAVALESDPERAVDLYAGPFLDGFYISGSDEFERWVDSERSTLRGQYTDALEALAREAEKSGDTAGAIAYWRQRAAADPLSSRVAVELMATLARTGDRAAALEAGKVHTALVREEFDAPPDAPVLNYIEELRHPSEPAKPPPPIEMGARVPARVPEPIAKPSLAPAPDTKTDSEGSPPADPGDRRRQASGWIAATFVATLALPAALLFNNEQPSVDSTPVVLVPEFENTSGVAALDPLGRMAADWITEGLARTGLVEVVGPEARENELPTPKREWANGSTRTVVEGRMYVIGDSLWIHTRITDPSSGSVHRVLEPAGARLTSPTEVLEPLRQHVLGALGTLYDPRISAWAEGSTLRPPSFDAYREVAAGLELHAVPRDLSGAAQRFRRASELDPEYVLPHLWLAWTNIMLEDYEGADSTIAVLSRRRDLMSPLERAWTDRMRALLAGDNRASYEAAARMVRLAPRSGWSIALANAALDVNRPEVAISTLLEAGIDNLGIEREHGWSLLTAALHAAGDYDRELEVTGKAIQTDGLDWGFAGAGVPALAALGRVEELEVRLEELRTPQPIIHSGPRAPASLLAAVTELRAHGRAGAADSLADRMLERERPLPDDGPTAESLRWLRLQLNYEMGRWDDAQRVLDSWAAGRVPSFRYSAMAGLLAARRGDHQTAERIVAELDLIDEPYLFGEPTFWRARIQAALGNRNPALRLIRQSFSEGQGGYAWNQLHVSRDFDALRDETDFQQLIQQGCKPRLAFLRRSREC